jgi:general stress protein 26
MPAKTIADLAEKMRDIDFTMLVTRTANGALAARPMSNNRDVDYDGDSYYFTDQRARMVADIEADPNVGLSFQGTSGILGQRPFFVAVEGVAELIREKRALEPHWNPDLDRWFPDGLDTPGLVMIHVHAARVHYWDGEDEGEIVV